jgi:hypothetical protein
MEMGAKSGAKARTRSGARSRVAAKRVGDGVPLGRVSDTGLVEESDGAGASDDIDFGYGHHT